MASGRSRRLGADIHEIDNSASRCGRLLDEVAGDAEAISGASRDHRGDGWTAKPYFGDVADAGLPAVAAAPSNWPSGR